MEVSKNYKWERPESSFMCETYYIVLLLSTSAVLGHDIDGRPKAATFLPIISDNFFSASVVSLGVSLYMPGYTYIRFVEILFFLCAVRNGMHSRPSVARFSSCLLMSCSVGLPLPTRIVVVIFSNNFIIELFTHVLCLLHHVSRFHFHSS